jgi:hypothetical protein
VVQKTLGSIRKEGNNAREENLVKESEPFFVSGTSRRRRMSGQGPKERHPVTKIAKPLNLLGYIPRRSA